MSGRKGQRPLPNIGTLGREIRQKFVIGVPDHIFDAFRAFVRSEEFSSEGKAVQVLLEIALTTSTPRQAIERSARTQAYNETRYWIMGHLGRAFKEVQTLLEEERMAAQTPRNEEPPK